MCVRKRIGNRITGRTTAIIGCAFLLYQTLGAQIPENDLRKILGTDRWSAEELTDLERGELVVRSLPTSDYQAISTLGVLRIEGLPPVSMRTFRESFNQNSGGPKKAGGRFNDPAAPDDLASLELDKDSIEQLRKCTRGKCDLNLSANTITRFQTDVDWNSPDAESQATRLVREMLYTYVSDYVARGDSSLGSYDNRKETVDLTVTHRLLLSQSTLITTLAPEFVDYLMKFPASDLSNVESSMHWSVVDLGLKPSITLSHAAAYTQLYGNEEQLFVASKQIYASRYLDASLTFTILLRVTTRTGVDTYLVFLDRSRSDALQGRLGRFARGIVQKESIRRIKTLLDKAHLRLLVAGKPPAASDLESGEASDSSAWVSAANIRRAVWSLGALLLVVGFLFLVRKRLG